MSAARVAGLAYLLGIAVIVAAQYGIYAPLEMAGDPLGTARNLVAHATLLRLHAVAALVHAAFLVVLLTALYLVLEPVHRGVALAAALLRLVSAVIWVGIAVALLGLLRLEEGMGRPVLGTANHLYYAGLPFYAAASMLCAWLWLRSQRLPRGLALGSVIASAWCAVSGLAYLVHPPFGEAVNLYTLDSPMALFEIAISLWLIVGGAPGGLLEGGAGAGQVPR